MSQIEVIEVENNYLGRGAFGSVRKIVAKIDGIEKVVVRKLIRLRRPFEEEREVRRAKNSPRKFLI